MNEWFQDDRTVRAQTLCLRAEQQQLIGNISEAQDLYREAAKLFASVALEVPVDHPNTRGDLGVAAMVCFSRAEDFGSAIEFAERLLAQSDALSKLIRAYLLRFLREHRPA